MKTSHPEFSLDDVRTCLENAAELRSDALRCSAETELVLLTYSVEEAAKGFVVVFERKLAAEGIDPTSSESLLRVKEPALRRTLERHKDVLTPDAVRSAFREHPTKHRYLTFVADFWLAFGPKAFPAGARLWMLTPGIPLGLRIRAIFWQLDHRDGQLTAEERAVLARLDSLDFGALEYLRKRALYVDLVSPAGGCTPPAVEDDILEWLEEVSELLVAMLDGIWIFQSATSKRAPNRPN